MTFIRITTYTTMPWTDGYINLTQTSLRQVRRDAEMSRMLPLEQVVREFKEHGYIFTDTEYRGVDVNHECVCSCGRTTMKSLTNVRSGKKCLGCKADGFTGPLNPRWNPELTDEEREDKRDTS